MRNRTWYKDIWWYSNAVIIIGDNFFPVFITMHFHQLTTPLIIKHWMQYLAIHLTVSTVHAACSPPLQVPAQDIEIYCDQFLLLLNVGAMDFWTLRQTMTFSVWAHLALPQFGEFGAFHSQEVHNIFPSHWLDGKLFSLLFEVSGWRSARVRER